MITSTFADRAIHFHSSLQPKLELPAGVELLNPFLQPVVVGLVREFYTKFYNDTEPRIGVFGINPGRFGAGLTGLSFTDPVALREHAGIDNNLAHRTELSSEFIYRCINQFGGVSTFFSSFYLSALCPLGFVRMGINYNFYDDPTLQSAVMSFVVNSMKTQMNFPLQRRIAIVLGAAKLRTVFSRLNAEYNFYEQVEYLEHPRFIMQYKRSSLQLFIDKYTRIFEKSVEHPSRHSH